MKGTLYRYDTDSALPEILPLDHAPQLELLQAACHGQIEIVPGFVKYHRYPCVAFSNTNGKRDRLPANKEATRLWRLATWSQFRTRPTDHLRGPVVILIGDREFFEAM